MSPGCSQLRKQQDCHTNLTKFSRKNWCGEGLAGSASTKIYKKEATNSSLMSVWQVNLSQMEVTSWEKHWSCWLIPAHTNIGCSRKKIFALKIEPCCTLACGGEWICESDWWILTNKCAGCYIVPTEWTVKKYRQYYKMNEISLKLCFCNVSPSDQPTG